MPPRLPPPRPLWFRLLPLAILGAGLAAFFALGWHRYLSFEQIRIHRSLLMAWVERWGALALAAYVAGYALMAAFSIPGGALATIVGGYLFGLWAGTAASVIGATIGAIAVFLAARTAIGDILRAKAGPALKRMEQGFRRNAFSYLLVLRLVPIFPFWLVNLVPAFCGVSLRTYAAATLIGIVPGSFVFVSVGNGLGALLDRGETPDLMIVFQWDILVPILGLALLALLPVVLKKFRRFRAGRRPA
ncbi:MAG: TVP38/TMEM64 family protein [Rhodospirillaceae bacterium]|nr:TVP38/TMEM64 family protein [Rhodospirillaceae bacterium]